MSMRVLLAGNSGNNSHESSTSRQVVGDGGFCTNFCMKISKSFSFFHDLYVLNVSFIIVVLVYWLGWCEEVRLS